MLVGLNCGSQNHGDQVAIIRFRSAVFYAGIQLPIQWSSIHDMIYDILSWQKLTEVENIEVGKISKISEAS